MAARSTSVIRSSAALVAVLLVSMAVTVPAPADELPPGWPGRNWSTTDVPAWGEGWFEIRSSGARYSEDDGTYYGQQGEALWDTLWGGSPPDHWPAEEEVYAAFASLMGSATGDCDTYCGGDTGLSTIVGSDYPWQMYWYDITGNVTIPWDHYNPLQHDPLGHACLQSVFWVSDTANCQVNRWKQNLWAYGDMYFGDMDAPSAWYSAQTDDCSSWYEDIDTSTTIYYQGGANGLFVDSVLGLPIAKLSYYDPICSVAGEDCDSGVDDDSDGYIDCDDCECYCDNQACPDNECNQCDDSIDNDGDGDTDCDDADCYINDLDCSIAVQGEGVNGHVAGFMFAWPIDNGNGEKLVEIYDESFSYPGTCDDERCTCALRNVDIDGDDAQRAKDRLRVFPPNYDLKVFYGITHGDDAAEAFAGDTVSVLTNDFNMLWQAPAEIPAQVDLQLVGVGGTPPCLQCVEHSWDWGMWALAGLDEFCDIFSAIAPPELCAHYHKMDSNDGSGLVSPLFLDIAWNPFARGFQPQYYTGIGLTLNGFDLQHYGTAYDLLTIDRNGAIVMGCTNGYAPPANEALPAATVTCDNRIIAPLWDEYRYDVNGTVWFALATLGGSYVLILQWEDVVPSGDLTATATFQAWLFEGSDEIYLNYQTVSDGIVMVADGASATVGVQEITGGDYTEYCNHGECPHYLEDNLTVWFYHE